MSNLTPELNLAQAEDDDDTADYLTLTAGLAGSLAIIDGLFSATTGHAHNGAHQGSVLGPNAFADNSIPGSKLVDGSVTAAKLMPGLLTLEPLYAGTSINVATNYTVAAGIMYVFCEAAVVVTLPAAASTNRPITVIAINGQSTVAAVSGAIIGGSAHPTTGAVQNGVVAQGEAFTYKAGGSTAAWRAV